MLANTIANLTNGFRMKRECKTWESNLHNTPYIISARPCPICLFSSKFGQVSTFALQSAEMSIRMQANLYKCLMIITNVLRSLQMSCHQVEWLMNMPFLTNIRSMFRIFPRPGECLRTLQKCLRTPRNFSR